MTTAQTELTEAQKEKRRTRAHNAIRDRLIETRKAWAPRVGLPDYDLAAALAMDALGDLAAEILVDGTMMRSLTMKDGVATLELDEATEIIKVFVAGMRGVLDGYGAENYVEMEMTAPSVSMDVRASDAPWDAYTVTVQRQHKPTPHQFRQRAEAERDSVLKVIGQWAQKADSVDVCALVQLLGESGHTIPGAPAPATEGA